MNRSRCAVLLSLFSVFFVGLFCSAESAPNWERVNDKNGITVERRAHAGSALHEFRGTTIVDATPARLLALFKEAKRARKWMAGIDSMEIIEREGNFDNVLVRSKFSFGLGLFKRQAMLKMVTSLDHGQVTIEFSAVKNHASLEKGITVLEKLEGQWIFRPISASQTKVIYQAYSEPGGSLQSLPSSLLDFVSKNLPRDTLFALKTDALKNEDWTDKQLEKTLLADPKYQAMIATALTNNK